ncbi:proton-coupled folate transporter isoform X3 [Apis mellifera]|uniref:Proton-coupled folate transporter isoform X3 n=1 Tax=Apis mellifera TaxID=7460 RepID=A0A7M7MM73_APIME|nr:proton-coupled folate transporter isoform X3 [Apis mellifera]|eukprot:XP_026298072.1 proton-coupled folate transporter isoform X3 [Apis mellifera]
MENELRLNENETGKKWKKFFEWIKDVSVEPTMWLFMMAFMITSVVEQAFFVYKSCRVDHGYSEKICSNLNDNETIKTAVQLTVSNFHQWNNIAGHVVPIILAFFYGNWSDRRGRKLPLIMGLLGKFIYSFMIVINSMMDTWNLNTVVYFATLPMGMLGGDVVIFGSCFAYISDITSIQQRTLRITILDVIYLSTMPTGVALGSYIYSNVVNKSYTIMFIINATLLFLAILYSLIKLKWQTLPQQQVLMAMLIGVPIMSKVMKIRDTIIVAIGAISHASGRIIFALAKIPELFYVGAGVAALGPIVAPVLRSMTSKLVTIEERGKIFAILSVCDNAVPLFSSILYSQLYNATINSAPSSIYWLTFTTQIFVLFLILIIHFSIKNRNDQYIDDEISN